MDIAAYSTSNAQSNVQTALNIGLMKESMVNAEDQATQMLDKMMPQTAAPSAYGFDTYA